MADLALGISGRLEEGETLQAWVLGTATSLQWQALVGGNWVNVGLANSQSYLIPAGAAGTAYRLAGTDASGTVYSTATPAATVDTRKANAPVLGGTAPATMLPENGTITGIFAWIGFSDADRTAYGGGSLLVQNSNATPRGGDGQDKLWIAFAGTGLGQFSYNAATREVKYAFTAGSATTIGTVDAVLNGNGTDLKIVFNANATHAVVDALINQLQFASQDDSPLEARLLTLRVTDPTGASAQRVLDLRVAPQADAPVVTSPASFAVDENQAFVGAVAALDPDREAGAPQGMSYSLAAGQGDADNALFEIDAATGQLRFKAAPDFENAGHGAQYSVRVRATDGNGGSAEQAITVTVRDVNEAPVAGDVLASVQEGAGPTRIDPLVADPDAQDSWTLAIDTAGTVGSVALAGDHFLYDPAGRFESLAAGAVLRDSFSYTVTDSAGHAVTRTVAVDVVGQNDAPVAQGAGSGTAAEAGTGSAGNALAQGQLAATDVDGGDTLAWSGSAAGQYGSFSIGADGAWTYTLDNARAATQALAQGQTASESFVATVRDAAGATAQTQVTVTVQGANDVPVIGAGGTGGTVQEPPLTGQLRIDLGGSEGQTTVRVDAAGRLVLLGESYDAWGMGGPVLARFGADGTPDAAFGSGGQAALVSGFRPKDFAFDAAGGTVCVGYAWDTYSENRTDWCILRYDASGQLDTAFGNAGRVILDFNHFYDNPDDVAVLADGKLLVTGSTTSVTGTPAKAAVRLLADGSLDASFGDGGVLYFPGDPWPGTVTVDAQGRFLILGSGQDANGASFFTVTRYLADGTLDTGFGDGGQAGIPAGTVQNVGALTVAPDGRIVLGWTEFTGQWDSLPLRLAMLHADGTVDTAFGSAGIASPVVGVDSFQLAFDAVGRLLVAYGNSAGDMQLVRLLGSGGLDMGFNGGVPASADFGGEEPVTGLQILADGGIVVSGETWLSSAQDVAIAAFTVGGAADTQFGSPQPGVVSVGGQLAATDPDAGDLLQWSGSADGVYGQFALAADGSWNYVLDGARAATQALDEGELATDAFTVTVTDSAGASASTVVSITIVGSYDVPQV